jgi:hypothetical protein
VVARVVGTALARAAARAVVAGFSFLTNY